MKALKTKVILSGIVLMIAFIATIGTTYAWFTVNTSTSVDSMEINVTAADNLLILPVSYDGGTGFETILEADLRTPSNYLTSMTAADLSATYGYLFGTWEMSPATIVGEDYDVETTTGKTLNIIDVDTRVLTAGTINSVGGDYFELRFWLYSQSATAQAIEMNDLSIDLTGITGVTNTAAQDAVVNAVRLNVWLDDTTYDTVDPSEGSAFVFGNDTDYGYTFTGDYVSATGNILDDVAANLAVLTDVSAATLSGNVKTAVDATDLFIIQPETPTLVTVLIYVEGWDAQATNDIASASFNISFGFKFGITD